jgi:hypothetical protein
VCQLDGRDIVLAALSYVLSLAHHVFCGCRMMYVLIFYDLVIWLSAEMIAFEYFPTKDENQNRTQKNQNCKQKNVETDARPC